MARETRGERFTPRFVKVAEYRPENAQVQRLKSWVRRKVLVHPALYWAVVPSYRSARRQMGRLMLTASGTPRDKYLEIDRQLLVPPSRISARYRLPDSVLRNRGPGWVVGGDWDLDPKPFDDDMRYRALRDVLVNGIPWDQTERYRVAIERIERGQPQWYCRTREEYDERCRGIERLYEHIKKDGFLTQGELRRRRATSAVGGKGDEVTVAIARDGAVLFIDGAHRLAIAKILEISRIPVEVIVRHADWMAFRFAVERYAATHGGAVPQPLLHPDLDSVPARQRCADRFELIRSALSARDGLLVDLGARWGYYTHRFEDAGFDCIAVEPSAEDRFFLEKLRAAGERRFRVLADADQLEAQVPADGCDVLLVLGVAHLLAQAYGPAQLISVVRQIRPREVFIEPGSLDGSEPAGPVDAEEGSLLSQLVAAMGYRECVKLGETRDGGPLFRLA